MPVMGLLLDDFKVKTDKPPVSEKFIELEENIPENFVHCENDDGNDQRSHGNNNSTSLKFRPCRPGNFMHKLIIAFFDIVDNLILSHLSDV